jgi:hypothetical protein
MSAFLLLPALQYLSRLLKVAAYKVAPVAVFFTAAGGKIVSYNFGVRFGELAGYR